VCQCRSGGHADSELEHLDQLDWRLRSVDTVAGSRTAGNAVVRMLEPFGDFHGCSLIAYVGLLHASRHQENRCWFPWADQESLHPVWLLLLGSCKVTALPFEI
jgi:hypothetical protein